jgi:hypothetical protein
MQQRSASTVNCKMREAIQVTGCVMTDSERCEYVNISMSAIISQPVRRKACCDSEQAKTLAFNHNTTFLLSGVSIRTIARGRGVAVKTCCDWEEISAGRGVDTVATLIC